MSVKAIDWALERDLRPGAKLVLIVLANFADAEGFAYPSQAKLARLTGQTERTVGTHLAALEAAGLIVRPERKHRVGGRYGKDTYELRIGRQSDGDGSLQPAPSPAQTASCGDHPKIPTAPSEEISCGDHPKISTTPSENFAAPNDNRQKEPLSNQQTRTRARRADPGNAPGTRPAKPSAVRHRAAPHDARTGPAAEAYKAFERAYPGRGSASNPWKPARELFDSAIRRGVEPQSIVDGAIGYAAAMASSGVVGSKFVAQAQTFIRQRRWEQYEAAGKAVRDRANAVLSDDGQLANVSPDCPLETANRWRRFVAAVGADQPEWAKAWLGYLVFDGTRPIARTQFARQEIDGRIGRFIEDAGLGWIEVAAGMSRTAPATPDRASSDTSGSFPTEPAIRREKA